MAEAKAQEEEIHGRLLGGIQGNAKMTVMATKQFVVHRWEQDGEPTKPVSLSRTMEIAGERSKLLGRPYIVDRREGRARTFRRRKGALHYLKDITDKLKVSDIVVLRDRNPDTEAFCKVRRVPDIDDYKNVNLPDQASSWPEVQKEIYKFVMGTFAGKVAWWGTCNCRPTRQGGSLSDHACCNAGDFAPDTMAIGDEIYKAVMKEFGNKILYISWRVSLHYDHLHISTGRCYRCS